MNTEKKKEKPAVFYLQCDNDASYQIMPLCLCIGSSV